MLQKIAAVLLGSMLLALGVNLGFIPNNLIDGGFLGIALILNYLWNVKVGMTLIILSIPMFMLAWWRNRSFFYHSLHGMLISSILIDITGGAYRWLLRSWPELSPLHPLAGAIGGGILVGCGIGIMLRHRVSTGGTDLLGQFIADFLSVNVGVIIFILDALVVVAGTLLLPGETMLLSLIAIMSVALATSIITHKSSLTK